MNHIPFTAMMPTEQVVVLQTTASFHMIGEYICKFSTLCLKLASRYPFGYYGNARTKAKAAKRGQ